MPHLTDPKKKILNTTLLLLESKSYNSISYSEISDQLGINKSSLAHHYPSKAKLGQAVVKYLVEIIDNLTQSLEEKYSSAWDRIENFFLYFLNNVVSRKLICAGGVLGAEYNTLPDIIQHELRIFYDQSVAWYMKVLNEGIRKKELRFSGNVMQLAWFIESFLQGWLILIRSMEDPKRSKEILQILKEFVKNSSII